MPFKKGETPEGAIPFEKGESGNPNGRPVGAISFVTIANKILDGTITIEQAGQKRKITRREKMILNIINDAVNEEEDASIRLRAAAYIFDRIEGKPQTSVDLTSGGDKIAMGGGLSEAQQAALAKILTTE